MQRGFQRTLAFFNSAAAFALFLLGICLAAYGPFLPWLGFYWDDFPISWIATTMGAPGLARYFSTNRPVWGLLYQVTTPLLGSNPLHWQVLALVMRWISGLALWLLLRVIWPRRVKLAAWTAALSVVYPGFSQQFISFVYSHFFIVLTIFLLSLSLMILALRHPRRALVLSGLALFASLVNLLMMEYFFLLDLLRPVLIWVVLSESISDRRQRLARAARTWLPYLAVFLGVVAWRSFFFGFHTYQPTLAAELKSQPFEAVLSLIQTALGDVWLASAGAWAQVFHAPGPDTRIFNPVRYWLVVIVTGFASTLFLMLLHPNEERQVTDEARPRWQGRRWALLPLGIGVLALFIAGGPFWLTDLKIGLAFPSDRFTLPFMLGVSLVIASLIYLAPIPNAFKAALLGLALAFAAGQQFQNAALYRQDWNTQRSLFWQMSWRIPAMAPGTLLLSNELPIAHYTDNSLSAPLNWIYDPQNDAQVMKYILYYPTVRKDAWLTQPQKGQPIRRNYLASTFVGNTDQVLVIYYNPPGCLRVLDPEIETVNWMVPGYLRDVLVLSSMASIQPEPQAHLPEMLYGLEPARNWCYYFEKADLARQMGHWDEVVTLGEAAFASGDYPNDPVERLPFIEGYARTGSWSRAVELTQETMGVTRVIQPVLCRLWSRIMRESEHSADRQAALQAIRTELECGPIQ